MTFPEGSLRKPDTDGPPRAAEDHASRRILLVDEPGVRADVLGAALYDVDEAADGAEALDLVGRPAQSGTRRTVIAPARACFAPAREAAHQR